MSEMIYKRIASKARAVRADIAATNFDMALSDGTAIRRKGDSAKTLNEADAVIELAEVQEATYQACVSGAYPRCPSSGCASLSCDPSTT